MSKIKSISAALLTLGTLLALCSTASADEPRIVVEGFEAQRSTMSLQLHASTMSISDDPIDPEGSAQLGGLGLSWRWDLVDWGGLELSLAGLGRQSESGLVNEGRGLFTASWLWYFARHSKHRFYGITGIGTLSTDVEIGANSYSYEEGVLVLGVGSEWMLGRHWMLSVDARALFLSSEGQEEFAVNSPPPPDDLDRQPYPEAWSTHPEERGGIAFNVGLGYRW